MAIVGDRAQDRGVALGRCRIDGDDHAATVAFVDAHTRGKGKWDEAKFQSEVTEISATFDRHARAEQCGPNKQAVRNSKVIFEKDAALVREQHYFSAAGAASTKKQLDLNYDQFAR